MSQSSKEKVGRNSDLVDRVRVLIVGPLNAPGGLARVSRMTCEGFDPSKFDISTCETAKDTPEERSLWAACVSHWRRWRRLVRALRIHKPDIVHIHTCSYSTFNRTILDTMTCRLLRYPYLLHVHGGLFAEFLASLKGLRKRVVAGELRKAARVIVLSDRWRTNLTQQVAGLKLSVIPNAVDSPRGDSGEQDSRGGGVLFVGDLSETKRPEDLLVAYAALPTDVRRQYSLTIVGDGEKARRIRLRELACCLGIAPNVEFTGSLSQEDIAGLMSRADVFVLPSRAEGMPLALLEAMRSGLPAIVTKVGAIPEMVRDGREAIVVDPADTLEMTRALKRLLGDNFLRIRLGLSARERVEEMFTEEKFRAALTALWTESANHRSRTRSIGVPKLASPSFRSILF